VPPGRAGDPPPAALKRMARALSLDSLRYLSVPDVARCLGLRRDQLCTGCVTGTYPTAWGDRLMRRARKHYRGGLAGRTYE